MRVGRFITSDGKIIYGTVEGDKVTLLDSFAPADKENRVVTPLSSLTVLTPVVPSKVVAVGLNYKKHSVEMKIPVPDEPVLFLKPTSSILAHGETISYPEMAGRVDYEAELAVVISREAKDIPEGKEGDYILGFTAFNDVTARDLQTKDGQWTRAKSFDTFAPFGPYIEMDLKNPQSLEIQAVLNGKIMQKSNTSDMIFPIPYIVRFVSRVMTLYPGDIIATGTPEGVGPMQKGDEIVIRIEGLDDLVNTVR